MGWGNGWMALGMLLIASPILIHILNRSRYKVEAWGAMMFLQKAMQVRSQRIRIEQLILLALRCLFLILLSLALARPLFKWGEGSWDDPTTHLIIFDDSYSMQQGEGEDNAWEKAKQTALKIVEGMSRNDNMLILRAGNTPKSLFGKPAFDKKFLTEFVEDLEPGNSQTLDLPKALDQAWFELGRATLPRHRVYLLTDGQVHGWREEEKIRWEKLGEDREGLKVKPEMYVLPQAPDEEIQNLSVVRVYPRSPIVDIFRPATFLAELHNTSEEKKTVNVQFWVDGKMQKEKPFDCPVGLQTIDFEHQFEAPAGTTSPGRPDAKPGPENEKEDEKEEEIHETSSHYVEVRIDDDDLPADNAFIYAVEVRHTIPVLLVDGGAVENLWRSEAGILAMALRSAGVYGEEGLFTITHQGVDELEDLNRQALRDYRAVVLADVPSLSRNQQFALETFVDDGGGLLVALGEDADAEFYQTWYDEGDGLFPVEPVEKVEYEEDAEPWHPQFPAGVGAHILDIFDLSRARVLKEVRVTQYWKCTPHEETLNFARFEEDPFLSFRPFGEGRVLVWTTSLNPAWTTFPTTQDYLPLVQNLMVYLSAGVRSPINLAQLDTLVYAVPAKVAQTETGVWEKVSIVLPEGKERELEGEMLGGEWVAEWQATATTGVYTVQAPDQDPSYFAVAYEAGEEDLTAMEEDQREPFTESEMVNKFLNTFGELEAAVQEETGVAEWWRWLVFFALLLLCLELYLGWRFSA